LAKANENSTSTSATGSNVGYEARLWQMADALRGSMDAAEYKHVVLGLLSQFASAEGKKGGEFYTPRCVAALPGQLFYSTQIPACLWFLARDKKNHRFRDRRGHVLFIDARKLGRLVDRTHRELTDEEVARIARTYHAWRGEQDAGPYQDIPGFCTSAALKEIRQHGHVLTPGRYVGAEAQEDDGEPFDEKMKRLTATLREQMAEARKLDAAIEVNLKGLGHGV
jgi:type I restriction-modification system DNA methylase subunit